MKLSINTFNKNYTLLYNNLYFENYKKLIKEEKGYFKINEVNHLVEITHLFFFTLQASMSVKKLFIGSSYKKLTLKRFCFIVK